MKEGIRITFYLDNRRKKAEGTYPVKLRLYQPRTTKERLYRTGYDLSEEEFNQGYLKKDPEHEKNRIKGKDKKTLETKILKLDAVKMKADEILSDLK